MSLSDAPRVAPGYMGDAWGFGTMLVDLLEQVPALTWPDSVRTYGQMRTDPQIAAVTNAYTLPIRSGTFAVDPAGCRDEVVALVADAWGLPILGNNDPPGPARRRGVDWDEHLRLALLELTFGHMPFAQRFDLTGSPIRARLVELAERLPSTISEILVKDSGELEGVIQWGQDKPIPSRAMVWYVHEREGANWAGRSMLRPAYGPWLIKHEMLRVLATSSRRFGMGVPEVTAPPGAVPAQVIEAQQLASSIRVGDTAGAGLPNGFRLNLRGVEGSTPDTLGFVRYLDQQMAQMALASLLNLDASPNGSRALGETMLGLLEMSWAATAREITTPATRLSIQIVDYNWGEDEPAPRIVATNINRPEATAEAIAALVNVGAITPDRALEAAIRERMRLPAREGSALPRPPFSPPATAAPAPAPAPADAGAGAAGG